MAFRVLVVDDEPIIRRFVRAVLEQASLEVLEACNGVEALELFQQNAGDIHVLLTDIVMPAMSGTELVTKVRAIHADLPVLFMSGYCDRFDESMNGFKCISKPFYKAELIDVINSALNRNVKNDFRCEEHQPAVDLANTNLAP